MKNNKLKKEVFELELEVQGKMEKAQKRLVQSFNITSVSEYRFICNHYNKAVDSKKEAAAAIDAKEFKKAHELLEETSLELLAFYMNLDEILDNKREVL